MTDLDVLKVALLRGIQDGPSVEAQPDPGYAAFERHQLLAIRFHRAARANAPGEGERTAWRRYFKEHFPRGDEHALRLWEYWRNTLVKDEYPGSGVVVSHGQAQAHWRLVEPDARLYVNLESMQDDFVRSVDSFIEALKRDPARRDMTLEWWSKRRWSVQQVTWSPMTTPVVSTASATSASVSSSHTTIHHDEH